MLTNIMAGKRYISSRSTYLHLSQKKNQDRRSIRSLLSRIFPRPAAPLKSLVIMSNHYRKVSSPHLSHLSHLSQFTSSWDAAPASRPRLLWWHRCHPPLRRSLPQLAGSAIVRASRLQAGVRGSSKYRRRRRRASLVTIFHARTSFVVLTRAWIPKVIL